MMHDVLHHGINKMKEVAHIFSIYNYKQLQLMEEQYNATYGPLKTDDVWLNMSENKNKNHRKHATHSNQNEANPMECEDTHVFNRLSLANLIEENEEWAKEDYFRMAIWTLLSMATPYNRKAYFAQLVTIFFCFIFYFLFFFRFFFSFF